jgi:hypothetical protein
MAMTRKERQDAYRERMYAAGYKQMRIWVLRGSESSAEKVERRVFLRRLEALTAGWSKAKLTRFLSGVLKTVKERIKEGKK